MKRLLFAVPGMYLLFAVIGRFVEGMGAVECGCGEDCWCKRPVLSIFRWVFSVAASVCRETQRHNWPVPLVSADSRRTAR